MPALVKGSVTVVDWLDVRVNEVALPMVTFVEPTNVTLPVCDAEVVVELEVELAAVLTSVTEAVSVLPSPTGGNENVRVDDVVEV